MKSNEHIRWGKYLENKPASLLQKVVCDLKDGDDIKGAALIYKNRTLLAHDMPNDMNLEVDIPSILYSVENKNPKYNPNTILMGHNIIDHKGFKILVKNLDNDFTILVLMQKHGYISLAMLDIENSIRWIEEIIQRFQPIDLFGWYGQNTVIT